MTNNRIERKIYILRNREPKVIEYVQGASAVPIMLSLQDYRIPEGAAARIYVLKPSGKGEYDTAAIEDNGVLVDVKSTMFNETGVNYIQAVVTLGDKTLITFSQEVEVSPNRVPGEVPESENNSDFLDEYLAEMDEKKANADHPVFTGSVSMGRKADSIVGKNSAALGEDVQAIGDASAASGKNTVSGMRGYYIKSMNLTSSPPRIYLCKEKVLPVISKADNTDTSFATPAYLVGDRFNIINDSHHVLCGTIVGLRNNVVEYTGNLGFTEIKPDESVEGHTFSVPSKPTVGVVTITYGGFASGEGCIAAGRSSAAIGRDNVAAGNYGFAVGRKNVAGYAGYAEGGETSALGERSHSEGSKTKAIGHSSHAEGMVTQANGNYSHAEGSDTRANGQRSHAEGYNTTAAGEGAHAEAWCTKANGNYSHAEGQESQAAGTASHSEGIRCVTEGPAAHAEGVGTKAAGQSSHAEGWETKANGEHSHAEGYYTKTNGNCSHAEGSYTTASGNCSHVQGKYNTVDTEGKYAHIVGNGTSSGSRSNAHTLDWDGNAWYAGSVEATALILKSSTPGSAKRFKITVDDSGTLTAVEI